MQTKSPLACNSHVFRRNSCLTKHFCLIQCQFEVWSTAMDCTKGFSCTTCHCKHIWQSNTCLERVKIYNIALAPSIAMPNDVALADKLALLVLMCFEARHWSASTCQGVLYVFHMFVNTIHVVENNCSEKCITLYVCMHVNIVEMLTMYIVHVLVLLMTKKRHVHFYIDVTSVCWRH